MHYYVFGDDGTLKSGGFFIVFYYYIYFYWKYVTLYYENKAFSQALSLGERKTSLHMYYIWLYIYLYFVSGSCIDDFIWNGFIKKTILI